MRDITPQIDARHAVLAAVGSGSPRQAARFAEERDLGFPLFTDPKLAAFRAAGLRRDVRSTFSPRLLGHAARALKGGHVQGAVQGDPWQQGGALVVDTDGRVLLRQVSATAGDHIEPVDLLAALPD